MKRLSFMLIQRLQFAVQDPITTTGLAGMDQLEYFDKVVVISLPRRGDRLTSFFEELPRDWPFKRPVPVLGVDGRSLSMPAWWNSSAGAWGCYRSHLRAIEDALCEGCSSILILEDDARCVDGFLSGIHDFYENVPSHQGLQYLGGQLLRFRFGLPVRLNDYCYRPFNVNRTHAYGIRGRSYLEFVYNYLADLREWKGRHHVDHYLGILHETNSIPVVCPRDWLFVQAATTSDITGELLAETTFRGAEQLLRSSIDRKSVAVAGAYRSGTSLLAGMLHKAGVNMGASFASPSTASPHGLFEALELAGICRRVTHESLVERPASPDQAIGVLRRWASDRCESLGDQWRAFGGKHPLMTLLVPELFEAWDNPFFVCTERPAADIVRSLQRTNRRWPVAATEQAVSQMIELRDQHLSQLSDRVLRIPYQVARESPRKVMDELSDFLGVTFSKDEFEAAVAHAQP